MRSSFEHIPKDAPTFAPAASITAWAAALVIVFTICASHKRPRGRNLFHICHAFKILYGLTAVRIMGFIEMRKESVKCKQVFTYDFD